MKLEDLEIYRLSNEYGNQIWNFVLPWTIFEKDTLGKQITRSADSVSANIAEGFGRFTYKERIRFMYFARGSLFETKCWLNKIKNRNLINVEKANDLLTGYDRLGVKINNFIASLKKNISNQ